MVRGDPRLSEAGRSAGRMLARHEDRQRARQAARACRGFLGGSPPGPRRDVEAERHELREIQGKEGTETEEGLPSEPLQTPLRQDRDLLRAARETRIRAAAP